MDKLVAVVLAAGRGRRMGQTKQLLPWGDSTVVATTLRQALASQADEVVLVTGHDSEAVGRAAEALPVTVVHNPDYDSGEMLSSLQVAVRKLPAGTSAILVMLADQPFIPIPLLNQLIQTFREGPASIVAPLFEGRRGNPVLIGAAHFDQILALPLGTAPRQLFQENPEAVFLLPVAEKAVIQDLDRPEDYEALKVEYHAC